MLLIGWSVVVVQGLYLARHLSILSISCQGNKQKVNIDDAVGDRRENLNQVWIGRCWALGSLGGWRPPSTDPVSGISSCLRMAETLTENGWTADQPRNRRNSETENWHHCLLWVGFQAWVFPYNSNKNTFNADYAEDCENDDGLKMNWSGGALTWFHSSDSFPPMDRSASTLHKAFALLLLFNLNSIHFVLIVRFFSLLVFFLQM